MDESFQRAIKAWSEIGLANFQKLLDEQGQQVVENQTQGTDNRKALSAKTKEFKKLDDAAKLEQIKGLLKMYQGEIDNLTNRAKYAESCFLSSYKVIGEVADPLPLLEASAASVSQAGENAQLRHDKAELEAQVARAAGHEEVRAKLAAAEQRAAKTASDLVAAKEKELNAQWDERQRSWELREQETAAEVRELKQDLEVAQSRLSSQGGEDPSEASLKLAQHNTTVRELERATLKVTQVEARNAALRKELEGLRTGAGQLAERADFEARVLALEAENSRLAERFSEVRAKADAGAEQSAAAATTAAQQQRTLEAALQAARAKLARQQDYDQIKTELRFLRSVEFGDDSDDIDDESRGVNGVSGTPATTSRQAGTDLEQILQAKNNKLSEELAALRNVAKTTQGENEKLAAAGARQQAELDKARRLVEQLENDLSTLNRHDNDTFSTVSGWTAVPRRASPASSIRAGAGAGAGGAASLAASRGAPGPLVAGGQGPTPAGAVDPSVLNIVTQQRDRFKDKSLELEEDLRRTKDVITAQRKELEAVKQDNLELYERVRYVQAHGGKDKAPKVDRFKSVYEEGLTSYQQFKSLETERALAGKGRAERVVIEFFKRALTEPRVRYGSLAYFVAVHLILVWTVV